MVGVYSKNSSVPTTSCSKHAMAHIPCVTIGGEMGLITAVNRFADILHQNI